MSIRINHPDYANIVVVAEETDIPDAPVTGTVEIRDERSRKWETVATFTHTDAGGIELNPVDGATPDHVMQMLDDICHAAGARDGADAEAVVTDFIVREFY